MDYGYLEFATPIIRDGLTALKERGVKQVLAVPGMLFAAGHAKNDIPSVLNTCAAQLDLEINYGRELAVDLKMLQAAGDRVAEALDDAGGEIPRHETMLVVCRARRSDPDANSNVSKVARMLWEGMGFGWCEVAYSGVTFPLVEPALEHATRLGYKRIVVFPYFLFTGILVERIYSYTDKVAARYPDIEFIKAGYLNDHPKVIDTFVDRIHDRRRPEPDELPDVQVPCTGAGVSKGKSGCPRKATHHHVEDRAPATATRMIMVTHTAMSTVIHMITATNMATPTITTTTPIRTPTIRLVQKA